MKTYEMAYVIWSSLVDQACIELCIDESEDPEGFYFEKAEQYITDKYGLRETSGGLDYDIVDEAKFIMFSLKML